MSTNAVTSVKGQRGRPFQKGQSGNPRGCPTGARAKKIVLLDQMLEAKSGEIIDALIASAIAGDAMALKLSVDRLVPIRRGRPVLLSLPTITSVADVVTAQAAILVAATDGTLSPEEAGDYSTLIENQRRSLETVDLAARIEALESGVPRREP